MRFHHIGVATKDIDKTKEWIVSQFEIINISAKIYDQNQDALVQMIETKDLNIELISGKIVEKIIRNNITYYHICYEADSIDQTIEQFKNSVIISHPKQAILFNNRKVAFLMTPIGIVELLEKEKDA